MNGVVEAKAPGKIISSRRDGNVNRGRGGRRCPRGSGREAAAARAARRSRTTPFPMGSLALAAGVSDSSGGSGDRPRPRARAPLLVLSGGAEGPTNLNASRSCYDIATLDHCCWLT